MSRVEQDFAELGHEGHEPSDADSPSEDGAQQPGSGEYATLQSQGPQDSSGAAGHPDSCLPCTFYCFTRRGCNRGADCRFCHLTHQSKLQQRREAWKKQQREKRKLIRERLASEAIARRLLTDKKAFVSDAHGGANSAGGCEIGRPKQRQAGNAREVDIRAQDFSVTFAYVPTQATLTIGQQAKFLPQLDGVPKQFRLASSSPPGLYLDASSGAVSGVPTAPCNRGSMLVEADMANGGVQRAALDLEVVDFTRGGFVIGHISEVSPGKYMLLFYVPEEGNNQQPQGKGSQGHAGGYEVDRPLVWGAEPRAWGGGIVLSSEQV